MSTVTLTQLVDRALIDLTAPGEQGKRVVMGSTALTSTSSTSLTLSDATGVNVSDTIEFGDELVLVTEKTSATIPVLKVSRGYYMTTPEEHSAGAVGHVNSPFPRRRVAEGVRRSFSRLEALGVPLIRTDTLNRTAGYAYVQLPNDAREVLQVMYWGADGRLLILDGWRFFDNLPSGKVSSGKALNVPNIVADVDDLEITMRVPYRWSSWPDDPVGDSEIEIPEGAEDLPALYAAAFCVSAREISRSELDRSEEWSRTEQHERGASAALARAKWQEFYRALDEARRLNRLPQSIIYQGRSPLR